MKNHPNIFVVGWSQAGKTPFSHYVAKRLGANHVEALQWLRRQFQSGIDSWHLLLLDRHNVNELTLSDLAGNPEACTDYVLEKMDGDGVNVIDGIYDGGDFERLFRPDRDVVVVLEHKVDEGRRLKPTSYEARLEAILARIGDLSGRGELPAERLFFYEFAEHICIRHSGMPVAQTAPSRYNSPSLELAMRDFAVRMERRVNRGSDV